MSNETLDEPGVVAKFGVPRRPGRSTTSRSPATRSTTFRAWRRSARRPPSSGLRSTASLDAIVAHADEIGGVVGENLRAALRLAAAGRAGCSPSRPTARCRSGPPTSRPRRRDEDGAARRSSSASNSGAGCATAGATRPGRIAAGAIAAAAARETGAACSRPTIAPAPTRRRSDPPRHYETVRRRGRARALAARARRAPSWRRFDTETTSLDPMAAPIVGLSFCVEPGRACYIPLAHRYTGAPDQLDRDARARARCAPWFADPVARRSSDRTSSTTSTCSPITASRWRGVAHDTLLESYVLEAHKPHDMDSLAWRHLDVKTISLRRRRRQGCVADRLRPGPRRGRRRVLGRGRRHHAAAAPRAAPAAREGSAAARTSTRRSRCRCARCCSRMERTGVLIDSALLARQSRELGERVRARWSSRRTRSPASRSTSRSPKQLGEILFTRMGLPDGEEDGERVSRRPTRRCCRSWRPTIRCRRCCSSTARCRSSSRPTPTSCRRW